MAVTKDEALELLNKHDIAEVKRFERQIDQKLRSALLGGFHYEIRIFMDWIYLSDEAKTSLKALYANDWKVEFQHPDECPQQIVFTLKK